MTSTGLETCSSSTFDDHGDRKEDWWERVIIQFQERSVAQVAHDVRTRFAWHLTKPDPPKHAESTPMIVKPVLPPILGACIQPKSTQCRIQNTLPYDVFLTYACLHCLLNACYTKLQFDALHCTWRCINPGTAL